MARWWLSFATDEASLGACIVDAEDLRAAHRRATELGINPGGEILGIQVPNTSDAYRDVVYFGMDRLITPGELALGNTQKVKHNPGLQEFIDADPTTGYVCEEHNS